MSSRAQATPAAGTDRHMLTARKIIETMIPRPRPFAVRFWDGTLLPPDPPDTSVFTLVLHHAWALRRMLLPPTQVAAGEAFIRNDWDVEGNMEAVFRFAAPLLFWPIRHPSVGGLLLTLPGDDAPQEQPTWEPWRPWNGRRSQVRDRRAVQYHYNIGNDFYALFLDRHMLYTGAYFATGTEDLGQAQEAKMELICRKLRLQPGERLLEIGCGWGGLMVYAAERFGVDVVGVTLSEAQAQYARQKIADAGLSDRCRVEICDYRAMAPLGSFDKVVGVGVCEHVGYTQLGAYFGAAFRALKLGGLFLNQAIGYVHERSALRRSLDPITNRWNFLWRYVFPGGNVVALPTLLESAEGAGFETRDVESLREHYLPTLRHWIKRLEAQHDAAVRVGSEALYRIFRFYMAGSAYAFDVGYLTLYQTLLAKPDADGRVHLPPSRADLFGL